MTGAATTARLPASGFYCSTGAAKLQQAIAAGDLVAYAQSYLDAKALEALGFLSVTCGPAGSWRSEDAEKLRGARVCVVSENSFLGHQYALQVCDDLRGVAQEIKCVTVTPDLEDGGADDFLRAGHTSEELRRLIAEAQPLPNESFRTRSTTEGGRIVPGKKEISLLRRSESVVERELEWFVPGCIPRNQITVLAGAGGVGKTTLESAIAAAASSGKPCFLSDEPFSSEPVNVLFLAPEDPFDEVLKPRLKRHGADESRIFFVPAEDERFGDIDFNSPLMEQLIVESNARLAILDPIQQFIPADVNMAYRNAVRKCLTPLLRIGRAHGCTFLIAAHVNKRETANPRNAISDSADIWDLARSVLMADTTEVPGTFFVSHEKCNGAELSDTVLYTLDGGRVNVKGRTVNRWKEYHSGASREKTAPVREEIKSLILDKVARETSVSSDELTKVLQASGFSPKSIERAKTDLREARKIHFFKIGFDGGWMIEKGRDF